MVKLFFGLPGCGKTTLLAKTAKDACTKKALIKKFKNVYTNVNMGRGGWRDKLIYIDSSDLGKYDIRDGLVLIDEATLAWDSRSFKTMSKEVIQFFLLHRHYNVQINLYTQQWNGVDLKIRVITDYVFFVYKTKIFGHWWTKYYRIPYGIIIPDPKNGNEKLGEIVQGYCKPPWFVKLFAGRVYRPAYYQYFDSWEAPALPPLPDRELKDKEDDSSDWVIPISSLPPLTRSS